MKDSTSPVTAGAVGAAEAPPTSSTGISPTVLVVIVILAVIFFVSGLLHLLVRFLVRKPPRTAASLSGGRPPPSEDAEALQRQLQQLFHLHDSGLDQAFIDALPVFLYREIIGPTEPFNCAVCLCEFALEDRLRLLPVCGHAFHLQCIDTWLLSNSTCPLCRGALFLHGLPIENPIFDFFDENSELESGRIDGESHHGDAHQIADEKRLYPVRLGKFRRIGNAKHNGGPSGPSVSNTLTRTENNDTSGRNLDTRRCYSMGSYQYVVGDADLHVQISHGSMRFSDAKTGTGRGKALHTCSQISGIEDGRRLGVAAKGESFSVSKIWLWPNKKGKLPVSSDTSSFDKNLPWL